MKLELKDFTTIKLEDFTAEEFLRLQDQFFYITKKHILAIQCSTCREKLIALTGKNNLCYYCCNYNYLFDRKECEETRLRNILIALEDLIKSDYGVES